MQNLRFTSNDQNLRFIHNNLNLRYKRRRGRGGQKGVGGAEVSGRTRASLLLLGINDFKNGYQPRCNIVNDEKGDLMADSHSIVARWRNYFYQLFNVHGVKGVGRAEAHTAEPLVPEPSAAEVELAIDMLKSHKSSGIDQIPAELIKQGVQQLAWRFINLLLLFGRRRNCLKSGRNRS